MSAAATEADRPLGRLVGSGLSWNLLRQFALLMTSSDLIRPVLACLAAAGVCLAVLARVEGPALQLFLAGGGALSVYVLLAAPLERYLGPRGRPGWSRLGRSSGLRVGSRWGGRVWKGRRQAEEPLRISA